MRILLTGSTGFLGNNLLRQLLNDGNEMVVTVRTTSNQKPLDLLDVEAINTDLTDSASVGVAIKNVDLVIHAAALIHMGWTKLDESRRSNVDATRVLAESARRKSIRMVYVSSVDTLDSASPDSAVSESENSQPKPASAYVVSKRESERVFFEQVQRGLDGVVVQPGFMVGPWDWKPSSGQMMLAIANRFTPLAPAGGCSVADVRDVASGIVAAYDFGKTGERYILGGENITYFDLWNQMALAVGKRGPISTLPAWINWCAGKGGDLLGKISGREPAVNSAATRMGSLFHYYSSRKAQEDLGYKIGPIDIALTDAWQWFKHHGYAK